MKTSLQIIFITILCLGSCSKKSQSVSSEKFDQVATEKYGSGLFECNENQGKTFALCKHQLNEPGATIESWEFFVFDKQNEKITVSETVERGSVKWFSDTEIQISKVPGTMAVGQSMDDYAWIVNVITGKKIKKKEYNKQQEN